MEEKGDTLDVIQPGEFIGEVCLMKAMHSSGAASASAAGGVVDATAIGGGGGGVHGRAFRLAPPPRAAATVVAEKRMRCYAFDHDALLRHFDKDPGALAAVTAAFGASLVEKVVGARQGVVKVVSALHHLHFSLCDFIFTLFSRRTTLVSTKLTI